MTPPVDNASSVPTTTVELMVAIGRIEEKLTRIEKLETRLAAVENTVSHLDATRPVKTTFTQIVLAISACVAVLLGVSNLLVMQENRTSSNIELEMLKRNQQELQNKVDP